MKLLLKIKRSLGSFLFVSQKEASNDSKYNWKHLILLVAIFLVTRTILLLVYEFRGTGPLLLDAPSYIDLGTYIFEHNFLLPDQGGIAKQFPGLPLLSALVNLIVKNMTLSSFMVSWAGSLGAAFLFLYVFKSFRLAVIFTVFTPHWVSYSSSICSEGLS